MTALYFGNCLKYNPKDPKDMRRDRVYVRGHVGPLRYKIFSLLGWIDENELKTYRSLGSRLKGHESMDHMPGVDITPSGSLGMGLSYGAGAAIMTKRLGLPSKHFVFLGDGEEQEGNISEAARHIASLGLEDIICIMDKNTKQLSRPTSEVDSSDIKKVWEGYGWKVLEISDGHDLSEILNSYALAETIKKPTFIISNTKKGKGLDGNEEHFNGYHTISACKDKSIVRNAINERKHLFSHDSQSLEQALQEINVRGPEVNFSDDTVKNVAYNINATVNPENNTNLDDAQFDYFKSLAEEIRRTKMPFFFLTPDLIHKEDVILAKLDSGEAYIDTGIREQHTIAMAHGMSQINPNARIFINYFDAFLYRAADQLNAAAQGRSRMILFCEMSGLTQGKNGETHQSSGQPAVPLMMPGVLFYEPADVQDLYNVLNYGFSNNPGIFVVRSHRADINPLERSKNDLKNIDHYVTFESNRKPDITLIGSGYVVDGLVGAAKKLEVSHNFGSRVINMVNMRKFDEGLVSLIESDRPVLTVYNGNAKILQSSDGFNVLCFVRIKQNSTKSVLFN